MSTITYSQPDHATRLLLIKLQKALLAVKSANEDHAALLPIGQANSACVGVSDWLDHLIDDIEDTVG